MSSFNTPPTQQHFTPPAATQATQLPTYITPATAAQPGTAQGVTAGAVCRIALCIVAAAGAEWVGVLTLLLFCTVFAAEVALQAQQEQERFAELLDGVRDAAESLKEDRCSGGGPHAVHCWCSC